MSAEHSQPECSAVQCSAVQWPPRQHRMYWVAWKVMALSSIGIFKTYQPKGIFTMIYIYLYWLVLHDITNFQKVNLVWLGGGGPAGLTSQLPGTHLAATPPSPSWPPPLVPPSSNHGRRPTRPGPAIQRCPLPDGAQHYVLIWPKNDFSKENIILYCFLFLVIKIVLNVESISLVPKSKVEWPTFMNNEAQLNKNALAIVEIIEIFANWLKLHL